MSQEAELYDGTVLEFPDGTDPGIIQQTAKRMTIQRQSAAPDRSGLLGGKNAEIKSAPGFLTNLSQALTAPFNQERAPVAADQPRPGMFGRALESATAVGKGVLGLANAPFETIAPTVTKYAGENLPITPQHAEAIGNAVGAVAQGSILPWRSRAPLAPARNIEDLIAAPRPGLPAPTEPLALPPPAAQPRLNPPEMVTQVTPEGVASQAPKRTIVDLIDEVKKDVKQQVIDEIFQEMKTGRPQAAAAAPKQAAPLSIEDLRGQLAPEARATTPAAPMFEQTEAGKQGVIPGAEARTIPQGGLRPKRAQTEAPLELEQPALRAQEPELALTKEAAPAPPRRPVQRMEDSEVAMSTFINRQGGMNIPKNLKEEFGGWWRLHNPKGLGVDVMADEAFNAGLLPEPTTAALIDSLKSGRKSARMAGEAGQAKQMVNAELDRHIKGLQEEPAGVEYKGHDYTAVIPENGGVRLKDNPDKVLKKADDIFKVEGKVPFDVPGEAPKQTTIQDRIAQLEAENAAMREKQPKTFDMPSLKERAEQQYAGWKKPTPATNLSPKQQGEPRTIGDLLKGEKGQIGSTETNPMVTGTRLAIGEAVEQSGKTVRKTMGPEGNDLIDRLTNVRNNTERNTGIQSQPLEDAIKKIDKAHYENFVDVLEGKARPASQEVADAVSIADKVRKNIAQRAEAVDLQIKNPLTGEYTPFRPREDYFPHYSKEQFSKVVENPTARADIKAQIKEQLGPNATDKQAEDALKSMIKNSKRRDAHLEIARVIDLPDYHKDPRVFLKYINDANRRIAIADQFGPKLEQGEELLSAIGQNHGDKAESFARTLFNRELRMEEVPDTMAHRMMQGARNYEVLTKLGRAFIPNMSQHTYTAIVTNATDTAKGIAKAFTKEGRTFARRAGVVNDEVLKEFYNEVTGASAGDSLIHKAIGIELKPFTWSEKLNRVAAANAGRYYANETFDALKVSPAKTKFRDTLSKMGIDVDAALKNGALSSTDELKAAQNIVNRSQFKVDPMELPLFWSSPEGKLLTQFKSFNFKSGQFMKDEILKEAAKGNIGPLVRAAALLPPVGYTVSKIQNALRSGTQDDKNGIADYLATVGVLGIFSDLVRNGGRMDTSTIAGPTLSDVGKGLEAVSQTKQRLSDDYTGNAPAWGPLAKFGARQVPVIGSNLAAMFNEPKSERQQILDQLGIKDDHDKERRQLMKKLGINR